MSSVELKALRKELTDLMLEFHDDLGQVINALMDMDRLDNVALAKEWVDTYRNSVAEKELEDAQWE